MNILLTLLSPFLFLFTLFDFVLFLIIGKNTDLSYRIFRKSFIATSGKINDFLSYLISVFSRKLKTRELNLLTSTNTNLLNEIDEFKASMNHNGYYQFETRMNVDELINLKESLSLMPLEYFDFQTNENKIAPNKNNSINTNKLSRLKDDLVNSQMVRDWALSRDIVTLAQEYLGSRPICDLLASWISLPTRNEKMKSKAAQKFHFDMDRIKFIKFFVYLTDVSKKNGPHCYIKSSNRRLPFKLRKDGRFEDEQIISTYGIENYTEIEGCAGTIIAVDTRGFHKGVPLVEGKRDILQVEYSNSTYGHNYLKSNIVTSNLNVCQKKLLKNF